MSKERKNKNPILQLIAGGSAGLVESSMCHPLDTIKTRMQLRRQFSTVEAVKARSSLYESRYIGSRGIGSLEDPHVTRIQRMPLKSIIVETPRIPIVTASLGPMGTARRIINREGFLSLYKGLSAVYFGIIPKMAIRFLTFEQYREIMQKVRGPPSDGGEFSASVNFSAGLASGLTEAILIVTPSEVCKIRMQSQYNSMVDPAQLARRKYTNAFQTAITIVREEGLSALYKGILPTMMRQGCNQAVNFSTYNLFKKKLLEIQNKTELDHHESLILGGVSGGFGPLLNNPLDVVKTRMQKQVITTEIDPKYRGIIQSVGVIAREEGNMALWRGITPRLMRIVPGQAITFMTYEAVSRGLTKNGYFPE